MQFFFKFFFKIINLTFDAKNLQKKKKKKKKKLFLKLFPYSRNNQKKETKEKRNPLLDVDPRVPPEKKKTGFLLITVVQFRIGKRTKTL